MTVQTDAPHKVAKEDWLALGQQLLAPAKDPEGQGCQEFSIMANAGGLPRERSPPADMMHESVVLCKPHR